MTYQPDAPHAAFLLFQVLRADQQWQALSQLADTDRALAEQVLGAAAHWVHNVVAPLSRSGDEAGCQWQQGHVHTPDGFAQAYQSFCEAGWPALAAHPEHGGQGLPQVLSSIVFEWLWAANHAWTMSPGLLHSAYACLRAHGNAALQAQFLPELASGRSLATMCLTEPHAGSDLGLVRTMATPDAEHAWGPTYRLHGHKCFITGGEHGWSDNILHLVLARTPDAPNGPKGLSLFLVPKLWPEDAAPARSPAGHTLSNNRVYCDGIESKMGLHASPTCTLRFEGARGWRVGPLHQGLGAMFVMMNAARLNVALQGIGLLDAAWHIAHHYAHNRRQMRTTGPAPASRGPNDRADLLSEHPAMRRILDEQRMWVDGGRVLAYRTALQLDIAATPSHPQAPAAQQWCSFMTPVLKAAWTAQAFDGASQCLQVLGGHGYVRDNGIEQIVRDARISMIYEGTNEIQAIDLLQRKVLSDQGHALGQWLDTLRQPLQTAVPLDAAVLHHLQALQDITTELVTACAQQPTLAPHAAGDYLRCVATVALAWAWAHIARSTAADDARWQGPLAIVQQRLLPASAWRITLMRLRINPTLAPPPPPPPQEAEATPVA